MEWTIYTTTVTVIAVVVALATNHFCMYVREHDNQRPWRIVRFETWLHKARLRETAIPQMRLSAPEGVVIAAKNVRCDCQHDAAKGTVHVIISGDFDEYDVRSLL